MRIIVCDDNADTIKKYENDLNAIADRHGFQVDVMGMISGERLLFELSDDPNGIDLILMDINFPDKMDGILATKQLREIGYENEIVFLTADESRVFESFDVEPLHYVVKDVTSAEKFEEIILNANKKVRSKQREMIALSCAGDNRNIPLDSILYFEVVKRIIEVHYDDEVFEFYSTIGKLENMLFDKGFIRVHRAFLVSAAHIASVRSTELTMDSGEVIPVGRTYSKNVKNQIKDRSVM